MNFKNLLEITKQLSVLYAEDEVTLREETTSLFESLFGRVVSAKNGLEALEEYKKSEFDIVITDNKMPKMSGEKFINEIRHINATQLIIIVSAEQEPDCFLDDIRYGVDAFISKPINFEKFYEIIFRIANIIINEKKVEEQKILDVENKDLVYSNSQMLYRYLTKNRHKKFSLMLYSVDNFTMLYENYGYEKAEKILKMSFSYMAYNLSNNVKIYKYNTDELVILLEDYDEEQITSLAIQINVFFKETFIEENIYISFSCGIVVDSNIANIVQKAKYALDDIRRLEVIGQFNIYEEKFIKSNSSSKCFIKMREYIEADKVVPFFQPIMYNEDKKIAKFETLLRIENKNGATSHIEFLEVAKCSGYINSLSKVILNKSFEFFSNTDFEFSINLTNDDLLDMMFVDFVDLKSKQYNIKTNQVTFEILESIIVDKKHIMAINNIKKLKELGFKIALDDFGVENSNLSRFESILDIDIIKIDGHFIVDIDKNAKNRGIVESIVLLAKKLDIEVIAEFVETKEEYEVIKELGIEYSQGYYFFKPMNGNSVNSISKDLYRIDEKKDKE